MLQPFPFANEETEAERSGSVNHLLVFYSLQSHGLQPTRLLCPQDFPGKNTGMGCHFLFQEIFLTQGLNPGLLHCGQTLYCLNHQGSPKLRQRHYLNFPRSNRSLVNSIIKICMTPECLITTLYIFFYEIMVHDI